MRGLFLQENPPRPFCENCTLRSGRAAGESRDGMTMTEDEVLEVVDAKDNVVGRATRAEVHETGLFHRAVHVFLFNPAGEVYVQRRSMSKDRFPGFLDSSAAGHVDPGESYHGAAVRELQEELAVDAEIEEVFRVPASEITDNEHVVVYRAVSGREPVPDPDEVQWGGFVTPESLTAWMNYTPGHFVPGYIFFWKEYLRVLNDARGR